MGELGQDLTERGGHQVFLLGNGWHILWNFLHIFGVQQLSRLQLRGLQDLLQGSLPKAVTSILGGEEAQKQGLTQVRHLGSCPRVKRCNGGVWQENGEQRAS